MNNILKILLIFVFLTNCSLNKNSKFWTKEEAIKEKTKDFKEIFKKEENLSNVFNPNLKISIYSKAIDKSFLNNLDNNNGRIDFNGNLKNISKYKFSKIENFHQYDPKISFYNKLSITFFYQSTFKNFFFFYFFYFLTFCPKF